MKVHKTVAAANTETVRQMEQGHIKKDQVTIVIQPTEMVPLPEKVPLAIVQGAITDLLLQPDLLLRVTGVVHQVTEVVLPA
jgi:hypothetical protein